MIYLNQGFLNAVKESVQISQQKWVKWQHEMMGIIHCGSCLALHDCWFVFGNEPIAPLHEKCHCTTVAIPTSQVKSRAKATSDYSKYNPYLFNTWGIHLHGKDKLFESWGYSTLDSEKIKNEIERQATLSYSVGDYKLGRLNEYGQRISITITLKRVNENDYVSFLTGWMVYPDGRIVLVTPYGGK